MDRTVYKVVFINDMAFAQERNFNTEEDARLFALTIHSWYAILKVEITHDITDITSSNP